MQIIVPDQILSHNRGNLYAVGPEPVAGIGGPDSLPYHFLLTIDAHDSPFRRNNRGTRSRERTAVRNKDTRKPELDKHRQARGRRKELVVDTHKPVVR